jgi:hypothetical protein
MENETIRLNMTEVETWREEESPGAADLRDYRAYARGDQGKPLTAEELDILGRRGVYAIADNVVRLILSTAASRLTLQGFAVEDATVANYLNELWVRNAAKRLQYDVHFAMLRDGNHAVSLRWKPGAQFSETGRVTLHREPWWDGESGLFLAYDAYGEELWAVKDWEERTASGPVKRRTVYYPDAIFRFFREGAEWRALPGSPVDWRKADGTPLRIPVIHFANSSADDSLYGASELTGLLGLQDDLNAGQRDMTVASAFAGFQMLYATGVSPDTDDLIVGPGRLIKIASPAANLGVIPPGDMTSLTGTHAYKRQSMAVDSSTPVHLIVGGEWPSGEALMRAEMPLVDKTERLFEVEGPSWVRVAHRSTELGNAFGRLGLNEDALISAVWADAMRLDPLTEIAVKQARVNLYTSLRFLDDPALIVKTGLLTEAEATTLLASRAATATVAEF